MVKTAALLEEYSLLLLQAVHRRINTSSSSWSSPHPPPPPIPTIDWIERRTVFLFLLLTLNLKQLEIIFNQFLLPGNFLYRLKIICEVELLNIHLLNLLRLQGRSIVTDLTAALQSNCPQWVRTGQGHTQVDSRAHTDALTLMHPPGIKQVSVLRWQSEPLHFAFTFMTILDTSRAISTVF